MPRIIHNRNINFNCIISIISTIITPCLKRLIIL
uniref:Uncharacterized protein n=1 Tax=virus sp. ct8MV80 TaxID=2826793 RepID=A0A8S5R853_9VIRU|nr:MAG TPA: hypothetical protein [virus sp. ct8MV80]